jgi:hypothetical protein
MATTTSKRSSSAKKSRSSSSARKSRSSSSAKKSRSRGGSSRPSTDEAFRYRQAAEDALQQLDWTIGYLHGIKKTEISKALAQNRSYIRRHLMGESDEGLPTQDTDET